ncbi:phage head-tail adapter protein [Tardibacter chloracetimidivorans]|uniref:Phage head-tail adapter protein n=1 Tax=Tardibacter chloracetimidivorans TaxID=1921510 RepID=A0A1L3ZVK8_9SPHN|nr:portal protein [Tardibacter chloracetimidivorans]API59630.1 phage head-tail adapter protein [Tardibacter chloracetimidivorans]
MAATPRHLQLSRWEQLKTERSSWLSHWQELSTYIQPRMGRFLVTDRNRGERRHNNIYDSTATRAHRILGAGMLSGATSPARPWLRMTTADPDLAKHHSARAWLDDVGKLILEVFSRSNTYRAFQMMYEELGLFGTGASLVMPSFATVQHHHPMTAGQYALATDWDGRVNTFYREFQMQVAPLVAEFGLENCTLGTQGLYQRGSLDQWITIYHAIEPRSDRDPSRRDALNMAYRSCYFEAGSTPNKYLRESGMREFRVLAPRWHVTANDTYGASPAMEALGDVKQLQHEQLRKAQAIDYQTKPPIALPTSAKGQEVNMMPGGVSYYDTTGGVPGGARSLFDARLDLNYLLQDIQDVRGRINSAFFADLFMMISQLDTTGRTATEIAERHEEKLLMLGPVLERLHNEMLEPQIALTFSDLLEAGALPPPPPEMDKQPIRVEFVSMLAQAQRAVGTAAVDRFVSNLGVVAQFKPDVLDKFNGDKWVDAYSDSLGVDPDLIVADKEVALIRQQRAEAQQRAEQAAQMEQMAGAANKLGNAPTQAGGSNALTDIMNMFSGYNSPSAESY